MIPAQASKEKSTLLDSQVGQAEATLTILCMEVSHDMHFREGSNSDQDCQNAEHKDTTNGNWHHQRWRVNKVWLNALRRLKRRRIVGVRHYGLDGVSKLEVNEEEA